MGVKYAAVDLGASSGRVMLGDFSGGMLSISEAHRFSNGPASQAEPLFWNIEALFKEIKTGLSKIAASGVKLSGMAVDTWGVDYVFLKGDGTFARPPYHYRDSRTESAMAEVYGKVPADRVYAMTGIQHMPFNTLYQLSAHQRMHPDDFNGTKMLLVPDALAYMLCGAVGSEYTIASTTQLLNPQTKDWNFELIDSVGLPRSIFTGITQSCSLAGTLRESVAKDVGCPGLPVYKVGSHDTASAVASVPATGLGDWLYLSSGTWSLLGAEIDNPIVTEESCRAAMTNEGGVANKIRFLGNIMGLWIMQECRRVWNESGKNYAFTDIEELANAEPPGRFIVNPDDKRFFKPSNMPAEIRRFCVETGQGEPRRDAEVGRCVFDSLALKYRQKAEGIAKLLGRKFERLHIVGGGSQNVLLSSATADCMGIPVLAGPTEATAIGNLISQAMAAGEIQTLERARALVYRSFPIKEFTPNPSMAAFWDDLYLNRFLKFSESKT